jgi:hypothetical protein
MYVVGLELKNRADSRRKFGKQIQKSQLEIPEYAASFVDYKALKKVCDKHASFQTDMASSSKR